MGYQKIINVLGNTLNQPTKSRTKKIGWNKWWIRGKYNTNGQVRFKVSMLRPSLSDYGDTHILVKGQAVNNANEKIIFKNCAPLTSCISKINNTQIDMINILMQ